MSDPKLLAARAEIEEVIRRHDIAAHVILHNAPASQDANGKIEVFSMFQPSYSKLIGLPPLVRLRSKLADYGGDVAAQRRDLAATANMVSSIATTMGAGAIPLLELAAWIDNTVGATHTAITPDPDPDPAH